MRSPLESRSGIEVAGEASNTSQTIELVSKLGPDMVLLDLAMPVLETIRAIHRARPGTKVLLVTSDPAGGSSIETEEARAAGMVWNASEPDALVRAIEAISQDRPPAANVRKELFGAAGGKSAPPHISILTAREKEILKMLAEGRSSKQAAAVLKISPRTVDAHRANIMQKLNLHARSELIQYSVRHGLVKS